MKKRFLRILLTTLLVTGLIPTTTLASPPLKVLALGDSITTGYGLANAEASCFTALLGDDYTVTNKAVNGNTVAGIAAQLQTSAIHTQTIAAADVITITIGGNDMMALLYAKTAEQYNAEHHSGIDVTDVSTILSGLNQSNLAQHYPLLRIADQLLDKENTHYFINSQEFTNALTTYQQMLVGITSSLKHVNPNVEIIVATQYNPYAEFADHTLFHSFYEGMEDGVSKLNETIIAGADAGGYTIADVKTRFQDAHAKTNDLCNADPDIASINLDFHPNADGHIVLAEVFKAAIEESFPSGTSAATLIPDAIHTRAQVIDLLWQTAGSPAPKDTKMPFTDIPADSDSYNAILWAFENGITAGTSSTTFSPDARCTQAQISTFLQRLPNHR